MRVELESPPGMLGLYARATTALLPFVGAGGGSDMPDLELVVRDVAVEPARVAKYARVCGFTLRGTLPPTYLHLLAFPLHMSLMTNGEFPFAALGLVHLSNRIVQHRPVSPSERLDVTAAPTPLEEHARGRQFTIVSQAFAGDELVWEEESRFLRRGGGSGSSGERPPEPELEQEAIWRVPGDIGRRYGDVSGDRNPIHLHDLTAKLFGFPRAIAHGMWTKARSLASLEPRLPKAFAADVRFVKPLMIPATVTFWSNAELEFAVRSRDGDRVHLAGAVTPA